MKMTERRMLTEDELKKGLEELPDWDLLDGKLHKQYKFRSFAEAIGWMTMAAIYADKIDHHPEWSNVYNRVTVDLITHDLYAVSTLDLLLARQMELLHQGR
jgi:4a-hydroxytetrahydrobiopterin dehydratase